MTIQRVSGGEQLQRRLDEIAKGISRGAGLDVGFLAKSTYKDGKPTAMIAAIHNFGAPSRNIPPRPFFDNFVRRESSGWAPLIAVELVKSGYNASKAMNRVGAVLKGQLQMSIRQGPFIPLKPATIARKKGNSKPLIDTSYMFNSVDWRIYDS